MGKIWGYDKGSSSFGSWNQPAAENQMLLWKFGVVFALVKVLHTNMFECQNLRRESFLNWTQVVSSCAWSSPSLCWSFLFLEKCLVCSVFWSWCGMGVWQGLAYPLRIRVGSTKPVFNFHPDYVCNIGLHQLQRRFQRLHLGPFIEGYVFGGFPFAMTTTKHGESRQPPLEFLVDNQSGRSPGSSRQERLHWARCPCCKPYASATLRIPGIWR